MKTVKLKADIPPSRELRVVLPADVPTGPAEITVTIGSATEGEALIRTFGDLLASGFVGEWAERDDIEDSAAYARDLRDRAWRRGDGGAVA